MVLIVIVVGGMIIFFLYIKFCCAGSPIKVAKSNETKSSIKTIKLWLLYNSLLQLVILFSSVTSFVVGNDGVATAGMERNPEGIVVTVEPETEMRQKHAVIPEKKNTTLTRTLLANLPMHSNSNERRTHFRLDNASIQLSSSLPIQNQASRVVPSSTRSLGEQRRRSHRKTVHIMSMLDCGFTLIVELALFGIFLSSLLRMHENDQSTQKEETEIDSFHYVISVLKAIAIIAIFFNVFLCVQLMHHTKPVNTSNEVLKRAEAWRCYNTVLIIALPVLILSSYFHHDFPSAIVAGIYVTTRVVLTCLVHRYILELREYMAVSSITPATEAIDENNNKDQPIAVIK